MEVVNFFAVIMAVIVSAILILGFYKMFRTFQEQSGEI